MRHVSYARPGFTLPLLVLLLVFGTISSIAAVSVAVQQTRATGVLNASIQALHAAESGGSYMVASDALLDLPDGVYEGADLEALEADFPTAEPGLPLGSGHWWVESLEVDDDIVTLWVVGEDLNRRTSRRLEVRYIRSAGAPLRPFEGGVIGCSDITLSGSGTIDSYDSREEGHRGGGRENAKVNTLYGDVTLPGGTEIKGDLHVAGNVYFSGSAKITGSLQATGDVEFSGGTQCPPASEVRVGGRVIRPDTWCEEHAPSFRPGADVAVPDDECDPLGVDEFVTEKTQQMGSQIGPRQSGDFTDWRADPVVVVNDAHFDDALNVGSDNDLEIDSEAVNNIFVDSLFKIGGSAEVRVKAPTSPYSDGVVRFYVDGDIELGGGAQFIIEEGASVEVYTTGKVHMGAGLRNLNESPTTVMGESDAIAPSFAIYSSHEGPGGVTIDGGTDVFASIYAPRSEVDVAAGGNLFGAIRGESVNVLGGAGMRYDEALGDIDYGSDPEAASSRIIAWNELLGGL